MEIVLIRHGQPEWMLDDEYTRNPGLTELGNTQSKKSADQFTKGSIDQLWVSPLNRTAQTLIPFDLNKVIVKSLSKTNKVIFIDEDVPGGATAYMMDQVINKQKGYFHLDSQPVTLTAKDHRPAYGTDGDYFSKPSINDIIESIYSIMSENNPSKYPSIY